ncbi:MAG: NADP oxidoreductase [Pedobacter sp.]|nr:MAG: NADP oxidoreductase [Pedobacter sp.]
MKSIGIVGAGQIGSTLAKKMSALGHRVKIANSRGAGSLSALAQEIGVEAVDLREAVVDVELLIISIPQKSIESLPRDLLASCRENLVVVDTGNYYPLRDGEIGDLEDGIPESQWVSRHLHRQVLKAFNSIGVSSLADLGTAPGSPNRIALPISGDHRDSKSELIEMIDALGFDSVDAGTISQSWRQQPGSPVYCTDHNREDLIRLLQKTDRATLPEFRDKGLHLVMQAKEPMKEARDILRALYINL